MADFKTDRSQHDYTTGITQSEYSIETETNKFSESHSKYLYRALVDLASFTTTFSQYVYTSLFTGLSTVLSDLWILTTGFWDDG